MGYCRQAALPVAEPVSLGQARSFLGLPGSVTSQDSTLLGMIQAAREFGEIETGRALAQRPFTQVLDSHPYYTDSIASQQAYPPGYYSLPRYSTTLWNYSQMIKLGMSPAISVQGMRSIMPDGSVLTKHQGVDFILDRISEPSRIFPLPGANWPPDLYVANALEIDFTAGYDADPGAVDTLTVGGANPGQQPSSVLVTGVPQMVILGILNLVAFWWSNRGQAGEVPDNIRRIFQSHAIHDWSPTRG